MSPFKSQRLLKTLVQFTIKLNDNFNDPTSKIS